MNKEIQKNREALIRSFILAGDTRGDNVCDCAKQRTWDMFDLDQSLFGSIYPMPDSIGETLDMTEEQWQGLENYYEGIYEYSGEGQKTFKQTALNYLQSLPGWPTVL